MQERLSQILKFLQAAESLKTTLRSAHTSSGRPESVAEHTWRLCLLVMVLAPEFPEVDAHRLMKICLVHDLGEALQGDIPAPLQDPIVDKSQSEREDLLELLSPLPELQRSEILELWEEYEQAATLEAKLAKAFDKLETLLQHPQGQNPPALTMLSIWTMDENIRNCTLRLGNFEPGLMRRREDLIPNQGRLHKI